MNHLVNIKKINKNTESNNNILSQNQQKTNNHNSYHRKHDYEKHDYKFCKNKNTQNFSTKFKTNNKKMQVHYLLLLSKNITLINASFLH